MKKTEGNIRDSYRNYKKSSKAPVNVKEYVKINLLYMKFLLKKVFLGHEVTLPMKMGTLSIRGRKRALKFKEDGSPVLPVDYAATKALWKRCPECEERKQKVYHTNEHSDGVSYRFFWSKKNIFVMNKEFYSLLMTRTNKRMVSALIKQEGMQYPVKM